MYRYSRTADRESELCTEARVALSLLGLLFWASCTDKKLLELESDQTSLPCYSHSIPFPQIEDNRLWFLFPPAAGELTCIYTKPLSIAAALYLCAEHMAIMNPVSW